MNICRLTTGLLVVGFAARAQAREYDVRITVTAEEHLYDLADTDEISADDLELLIALFHRPMDLNRADRYALYDLPGLTWALVDAIIARRVEIEAFTSVDDLLDVPGMTESIVNTIRPFTRVEAQVRGEEVALFNGQARTGVVFERIIGDDLRSTPTPPKPPSAYLQVSATGFTYFGAGLQLLVRPLVSPVWDRSLGTLVDTRDSCDPSARTACFQDHPALKGAFITVEYDAWRIVAGTYNLGFGQRLTIDTTKKEYPRGWEERLVYTIDRQEGKVRPVNSLRGIAVTLDGADTPVGWLDATAFFSYQSYDRFRNDIWYGGDEYGYADRCESDSDCDAGYTCRVNNRCYSSTVYEMQEQARGPPDPLRSFSSPTFQDLFSELMGGGNVTFNFDERTSLGVTAYRSHVGFNLPAEAGARFAPGATYPRRSDFGTASIDGRFGVGPVDAAAEVGVTHRGWPAAVAQVILAPLDWMELTTSFRWYSRDYDNPHGRSTAAATETFGSRRRNEIGGRLEAVLRPIRALKTMTRVDLYDRHYREGWQDGKIVWTEDPISYLRLRQRASYELTSKEDVTVQFDYSNNDLAENGRGTACESRRIDGLPEPDCGYYSTAGSLGFLEESEAAVDEFDRDEGRGRGEKFRWQLTFQSTRLLGIRLHAKYVFAAVDEGGEEFEDRFDLEHYARVAASSPLWEGARFWMAAKYWLDRAKSNSDDDLMVYVGFSQSLWDRFFHVQVVYGIKGITRTAGFELSHFGELRIGSRF